VFVLIAAVLLGSWRDRRFLITALTICAVAVPFVAAISLTQGRFTLGDSGWLNYSWHVTGMSVEGYKESAHWPGREIRHPMRVLLQHPRVLGYEQHLIGTFPVHAEPSWWCAGYPVRFDKARQLMILWSNVKFSIYAFRCPALLLILICLPFGAAQMTKRFAQAWFVWVPGLLFALSYCPVYSDYRYLAGSYALIGFALVAAAWQILVPRRAALASVLGIPALTAMFLMGVYFRDMIPQFIAELTGNEVPPGYFDVQVAQGLRRQGLQPGDRVAYIGFAALGAAHVGLDRAHIVASVPETVQHNDTIWGRPYLCSFPKPDEFWRSSPETKQRAFEAFRSVGAKWIIADCVPKWADRTGCKWLEDHLHSEVAIFLTSIFGRWNDWA